MATPNLNMAYAMTIADEDNQNGNTNMQDGFVDYVTKGIPSAFASATVGVLNTFNALGSSLGADTDMLDEKEVISDWLGKDTAGFYDRHKAGVDVAGLLVSGLGAGGLALKAVKVAASAGKLGAGLQAATGMENAGVLLGSKAVQSARASIIATGSYSLSNPLVMSALKNGAGLAAAETVMFTAFNSLLNNQNAALNPDKLSYWDSALTTAKNDISTLNFALGGAAAGYNIFRARGFLRGELGAAQQSVNSLFVNKANAMGNLPNGSAAYLVRQELNSLKVAPQYDFAGTGGIAEELVPMANARKTKLEQQLTRELEGYVGKMVEGQDGEIAKATSSKLLNVKTSDDEFASVVANLQKAQRISAADDKKLVSFYNKTKNPTVLLTGVDTFTDAVTGITEGTKRLLMADGRVLEATELSDQVVYRWLANEGGLNANGMASPNIGNDAIIKFDGEVYPVGWAYAQNISDDQVDAYNRVRKFYDMPELSSQERNALTVLHELGHLKNNGPKAVSAITKSLESGDDLAEEILRVSFNRRPDAWANEFFNTGTRNIDDYIQQIKAGKMDKRYLNNPKELLADAAALLLNTDTKVAQEAAKSAPKLAKFLESHGGLARPWKQKEAYLDVNTGKVATSVLPGASDLMPLAVVGGKLINSETKAVVTGYDSTVFEFDRLFKESDISVQNIDHKPFSSQWTLASKLELPFDDANKLIEVPSVQDLPLIQRAIALASMEGSQALGISIGGKVHSLDQAKSFLKETKLDLLDRFTVAQRYNEQMIAQILDIPVEVALGHRTTGDELLPYLTGRDYTKPQFVKLSYDKVDVAGVDLDSRTEEAIQMRLAAEYTYKSQASTALLRGQDSNMVDQQVVDRAIDAVSDMDPRQGALFATRPEIGTLRMYAAEIGRYAQDLMTAATQKVERTFEAFAKTINHTNSYDLRAELVGIDNIIRRDWYTMRTVRSVGEDGEDVFTEVILKKSLYEDKETQELLDGLLEAGDIDELKAAFDKADLFVPSKEASEFFRMHKDTNQSRLSLERLGRDANGEGSSFRDDVLYPPPRDLKVTPHHLFVVPNAMTESTNNARFMVTAATAAELDAKVAAISSKYGNQYRIITRQDAKNYKLLQEGYSNGKVFDELEFDASLRREFKDSELAPNMDIYQSSTLERYRAFHARKEEGLVRRGIELRYPKMFAQLNRMDAAYGATVKQSVFKKGITETDNIWADTRRTALALQGKQSEFIENYTRVSGWLNRQGSDLIDNTIGVFTKQKEPLTEMQMMEMNKRLDEIGFTNPYSNFFEMVTASPNTIQSRSLPTLTRTLNVTASLTMLTADILAAVTNAISSPIMSLPVVREAMKSLKGTEQGAGLERMLTATNPVNGAVEPSAQRLLMDSTQKFFTQEGKDFIGELRKRRIVRDEFVEYRESQDMSDFNGVHGLGAITNKIEQLRTIVGKYTQYQKADDFSKFMTAWSVKQICQARGIGGEEMYAIISSSVDKTTGIFRATQRGQLFNGVIGQAVGLFQNYTFNWLQNAGRNIAMGEKGNLAMMAAAQASIFGVRSMPGFELVNEAIGNRNRGNEDLYTYTNATEYDAEGKPVNPWMQYVMYGLGSHALGIPVDLYNRGNMNPRQGQPLYVPDPTDISQYPGFNIVANGVATLYNMAKQVVSQDVPVGQAIVHGLAHNGMNRPLQGLFTIAQGQVTSRAGNVQFDNANYVNGEMALGLDTASMTARALGGKPLREAILVDEQYRQKAYQVANKERVAEIGEVLRLKLQAGEIIEGEDYDAFARKYEAASGKPQGFNAYLTQILKSQDQGAVQKFKDRMTSDSELRRSYRRMLEEQDTEPVYNLYPMNPQAEQEQ